MLKIEDSRRVCVELQREMVESMDYHAKIRTISRRKLMILILEDRLDKLEDV